MSGAGIRTRLSSRMLPGMRWVMAVLFGLFCAGFAGIALFLGTGLPWLVSAAGTCTAALLGGLIGIQSVSVYVDSVCETQDGLVVETGKHRELIGWDDIGHVTHTIWRPAGVLVELKRDSTFGRTIRFLPEDSFAGTARHLMSRVAEIRKP
jgi:hypothetical protein